MRIDCLRVRVTLSTTDKSTPLLFGDENPTRPALLFTLPNAEPTSQTPINLGKTATEETQEKLPSGARQPDARAREADPRLVADRVYEMMFDEVRLTRWRRGE